MRDMNVQFTFYGARVFPDDAAKVRHAAMFLKGRAAEWWDAEDKSTGVESKLGRSSSQRLRERYRPMQAAVGRARAPRPPEADGLRVRVRRSSSRRSSRRSRTCPPATRSSTS